MYIFYDTETSGLEKDFAQIFQIGMAFTDDDMNILATKKIESRKSPWVVPAPGAMLTTGFTPDDLKNTKTSSFEMMQEVDQWVRSQNWPVIFVGYNSIGYDDDVLAQNLHQNLLDNEMLWAKSPTSGRRNSRFDVMIAVQAVQAYQPGTLKLDIMNNAGHPSIKLGNVARQNGIELSESEAHDGMNDTKATVAVAKLLKKSAPQIWDQMVKMATLDGASDFLDQTDVFTHTISVWGNLKSAVTTSVTTREGSGVTQILFDLSLDPAPYMEMSVDELKQVILDQSKRPPRGEVAPTDPFRFVRKTDQPILMPLEMSDPVLPADFDEKVAKERAAAIKANTDFHQRLGEAAKLAKEEKNSQYATPSWTKQPEQMMYSGPKDGPVKDKLEDWMREFREAPSWKEAADLVANFRERFEEEIKQDPEITRFVKFAGRIVFENAPEELSVEKQEAVKRFIAVHILNEDETVPWMTIKKARTELEKIEKDRANPKKDKWEDVTDTQIRSLKLYYTAIEKEYAPYLEAAQKLKAAKEAAPPANDDKAEAKAPEAPEAKKPSSGGPKI